MSLNKKTLSLLISTLLVIVVAVGVILGYKAYINSKVEKGFKQITVNVVVDNKTTETFKYWTEAEFLGQALDEKKLIETENTSYGRYVVTVNNITANTTKQEWWKIIVNGKDGIGIDVQAIKHGDVITLELKVGW